MKMPQFIVMSYPRTGTTLLCDSLGRHPDINEAMEVFHYNYIHNLHENWRENEFKRLYDKSSKEMKATGREGQPVLDYRRLDFVPFFKSVVDKFNGFKLLYHQAPADAPFWDFFHQEVPSKIIYLQRDFLEACVSKKIAYKTGVWQKYSPEEHPPEPSVNVSIYDLHEFYNMFYNVESSYRKRFSKFESITVHYNDLCENWNGTMRVVQEFLGIDPIDLPQHIFKKATKPTKELIANYECLMKDLGSLSALDYVTQKQQNLKRLRMV